MGRTSPPRRLNPREIVDRHGSLLGPVEGALEPRASHRCGVEHNPIDEPGELVGQFQSGVVERQEDDGYVGNE